MDINERILLACKGLIADRGLRSFSMDELAENVGISKRTLYRYFRSKDEVIEATITKFMTDFAAQIREIMLEQSDSSQVINGVLNHLILQGQFLLNPKGLDDLRRFYPHLWQKIDRFRAERVRELLQVVIARSEQGNASTIDPRILAAIVIASIQAVLNPDFILENGFAFEDVIGQVCGFLQAVFL